MVRIGLILTGLLVAIASAEGQRAAPRPSTPRPIGASTPAPKSPYFIRGLSLHPLRGDGAGIVRDSIDGGVQLRAGARAEVGSGIPSGPLMVFVDIGGPVDGIDWQQISYSSQLTLSLVELFDEKPIVRERRTVQIAGNMVVEPSGLGGRPTQLLPFLIHLPVSCGNYELQAAVSAAPGAPAVNQRTFKFSLYDECGN